MKVACTNIAHRRRGFTLIEILIGVIVLALGLLGLAAVFPVVVREQRIATQQTLGAAATDAAIADVLGNDSLRPDDTPGSPGDEGWARLAIGLAGLRFEQESAAPDELRDPWYVPGVSTENLSGINAPYALPGGVSLLGVALSADTDSDAYAALTIDADNMDSFGVYPFYRRLIPSPFTEGAEPRFVWDAVFRASPNATSTAAPSIQVAMFIRPIDQNIRVPRRNRGFDASERELRQPLSISDVLGWPLLTPFDANGLEDTERRLPVVVDDQGRPTRDGDATKRNRYYSLPYVATVDIDATNDDTKDRFGTLLIIDTNAETITQDDFEVDNPMPFIRIVGQKLLGDDGRVYEVVGIPEGEPNGVIVTPALRAALFENNGDPDDEPFLRPTQVVFTPQIPVEIRVFEVPVR